MKKKISEPNLVFNYVRDRLIGSVSKDGQSDGFDGILLRINCTTNQIDYAAANCAPILISKNNSEIVLVELPKDKMPVGQYEQLTSFNLYTVNYTKNDVLYLYTDGFADQFGGPKGKKFKYKPLNDYLLSICQLPFDTQQIRLAECFENWKGNLEQVDDVCVMGIKI